jgi:hypothetical protein
MASGRVSREWRRGLTGLGVVGRWRLGRRENGQEKLPNLGLCNAFAKCNEFVTRTLRR